jgi:sulfite oxidase
VNRFGKNAALRVWTTAPFNAEPPLDLLVGSLVTPIELFYVRNHGEVPEVDPAAYRLEVVGMVDRPLELSLEDLRDGFARVTLDATLNCAGNRRSQLIDVEPIPGEVPWRDGAIGNGSWTGARLADVLAAAGVDPGARHVSFAGLDESEANGHVMSFGGSIPLVKAVSPETLLAYELNGAALPPVHGFPVRALVPGYIGARSVKWLSAITVGAEPSTNYFQTRAYKLFPRDVRPETADWDKGIVLGELSVNSAICRPGDGKTVPAGQALVEGWASAGGDRLVARVEVSRDGGKSWLEAQLVGAGRAWTWCLWRARLEPEPGPCELVVRAWDSAANTQPEDPAEIWNLKGYVNNAWQRVRITVAEGPLERARSPLASRPPSAPPR